MSTRSAALAELLRRLQTITVANGFSTDAGKRVYDGEHPTMGPEDPVASISIEVRSDIPSFQGENVFVILPVSVQVIVKTTGTEPRKVLEDTLSDVKTAVETDFDLAGTLVRLGLERGATEPIPRESEFVGVEVEYRLNYLEGWGKP